ncbi:MAG: EAL domain-containing protein [Chloroflexi bacterium]|nr:MAG: EAL domain-containing protein [Chloroflexota bacterium]
MPSDVHSTPESTHPAADAGGRMPVGTKALAALHELAIAASGQLEPQALAKMAVDLACDLLGVDSAALYWWVSTDALLHSLADNRKYQEGMSRTLQPGKGVAGVAFQRVAPILIDEYPKWEGAVGWALEHGVQAAVGIPLVARGRPVGAMAILTHEPRRFDDDDLRLLNLLAAQVAPSLEAGRLDVDLAASEQRFRSLYGTVACGVLVLSASGVVLQVNPAGERILGLSGEAMRGKTPEQLWRGYREDGTEIAPTDRLGPVVLRGGRPVHGFIQKTVLSNDRVLWLLIDAIPVFDAEGKAVQVVASFVDMTDRKRVEEALRESEERFRAVFDRAALGIARIDLSGRIIEANPALVQMLGYTAEELTHNPLASYIHPDHLRDGHLPELGELAEGARQELQQELRYVHKGGGIVWSSAIASLVRGPSNEPLFVIVMAENISARKAQERILEHQALHDALTDLPNRTLLYDRLQQAILIGKREQHPLALLVMDLDRFKEINDSFGHHAGDDVLRQLGRRLKAHLRESDTVSRLGGDEFAVILPGVRDEAGATLTAGRILEALTQPVTIESEQLEIRASVGIVLFPRHGEDADTLLRHGDAAMYQAKRSGAGTAIYQPELGGDNPRDLTLTFELRRAIDEGGLVLHYQPVLECRSGEMVGVEALVRWQHPRHGLIGPDRFIGIAEQSRLIRPLGRRVLEAAVAQQELWWRQGLKLRMAVNLSLRNLQDPELIPCVIRVLEQHAVPAEWLTLEITESTLMADADETLKVLSPLKAMGVRVAIDDFGTGFSSLTYLKRLPIDELKIDKSFVIEMPSKPKDSLIVRSTIDLAHALGLKAVAEGVEEQQAWEMLLAHGCDLAQGYYFSRPVKADEIMPWRDRKAAA